MELATKYSPEAVENRWYEYWMQHKLFHSTPIIALPIPSSSLPPTSRVCCTWGICSIIVSRISSCAVRVSVASMPAGVPGTDHASIATEAKVVGRLAAQGIQKHDLTREAFLEHAWDWTREHGGIILEQLKRLGASCDWERTAFTMDDERSQSVIASSSTSTARASSTAACRA